MKAILKHKAVLAGLTALLAIGSAAGQVATAIWDVELLADGSLLYAAAFAPEEAPEWVPPPSVGIVDWDVDEWGSIPLPFDLQQARSAERLANGEILIADTGNNRVIEVDASGAILHVIETGYLHPSDARRLANGNTLLVDSGNHRVIEVNAAGQIVWQFGTTGVPGAGPRLRDPNKCERLANGNTLLIDTGNNRVIEVNAAKQIVRSFASGLSAPHAAVRLANGNTLIADDSGAREYTLQGQLVRTIATSGPAYDVEKLANGNTLLTVGDMVEEYSPQGQLIRVLNLALLGIG